MGKGSLVLAVAAALAVIATNFLVDGRSIDNKLNSNLGDYRGPNALWRINNAREWLQRRDQEVPDDEDLIESLRRAGIIFRRQAKEVLPLVRLKKAGAEMRHRRDDNLLKVLRL